MKVKMIPGKEAFGQPNGISRVIEKYYQHSHLAGIEFVEDEPYDLVASHAGATGKDCDVAILHGIYFTGDYMAPAYEYKVNQMVVDAVRSARVVTVPTRWVSEIFQRDMHINPVVVPHGIDVNEWDPAREKQAYVLYNKNRDSVDVCNSVHVCELARRAPDIRFVSTFARDRLPNIQVTDVLPPEKMKGVIEQAGVYLSVTKETFGIGILEAMASGVPILGWAQGGNLDLVQHGINGYLARFGNYDDLLDGLEYCIQHRKTLGANGRELAKQWTWENSVRRLRSAFEIAQSDKRSEPGVSVVIPVYNYGGLVIGAVDSVTNQTQKNIEIILVNDGSTDNTAEVIEGIAQENETEVPIRVFHKENGGVATARNLGWKQATKKYVCFLDADDAIMPEFLETCVNALEQDRSLYIAYTGLQIVDGMSEPYKSGWPHQWNYDMQLTKNNQVPTCCVMRKEVLERTGGYRQRYAPEGAGSEDAELWTRVGALGMKAQKVSEEPMFIYTWGGRTSGNRNYKETEWLSWLGYVKTKSHPFASYASPHNGRSHPVHQYDDPLVSVIIPVGPGHEGNLSEALDSVEGQTNRQWEAIVVLDTDKEVDLGPWPFVQLYRTATPRSGAGAARNVGARNARGKFLLFLDADDWLDISAIDQMLMAWASSQSIVYTDYYSVFTTTDEDAQGIKELVSYNKRNHKAVAISHSQEYNCQRAQSQPDENDLYHWCVVTCLVPKQFHNEIGGYDETMVSWEDVDYHWRMARAGKCYVRIPKPLFYYQFDTGKRRNAASADSNLQVGLNLLQYMQNKYTKENVMPCVGCGGQINPTYTNGVDQQIRQTGAKVMADENFSLIVYNHPNKGEHRVFGPATNIDYGYRAGGDQFLAHYKDIELMPRIFTRVDQAQAVVQAVMPVEHAVLPPAPTPMVEPPKIRKLTLDLVPGVTPAIAKQLEDMGYTDMEKCTELTKDILMTVKGVGETRANAILKALKEYADNPD